jgi:hypothetical protein
MPQRCGLKSNMDDRSLVVYEDTSQKLWCIEQN